MKHWRSDGSGQGPHWCSGVPVLCVRLCLFVMTVAVYSRAAELQRFPLSFARGEAMGGVGVALASGSDGVYCNPAFNADFHRFAFSLPAADVEIDNSFFTLMRFLGENREQFDPDSAATVTGKSEGFDKLVRELDTKWYGLNANVIDLSVHFRHFAVLLRNEFSADFQVNRGLLFPFVVGDYGQVRELSVVYGRPLGNRVKAGVAVKGLVQRKRQMVLAVQSVGEIDSNFWKVPEEEWVSALGLDFGTVVDVPVVGNAGLAVRDIGYTIEGRQWPEVSIGWSRSLRAVPEKEYSFLGDIVVAADLADIMGPGPGLAKLKTGIEAELNFLPRNWLTIRFRAGLNGGYPCVGVGGQVLKVLYLDYATYAVERGYYVGQEPRRTHQVAGRVFVNFGGGEDAVKADQIGETEDTRGSEGEEGKQVVL